MSTTTPAEPSSARRKVASTTNVAPCSRWAGPNSSPRRLCATIMWSRTVTLNTDHLSSSSIVRHGARGWTGSPWWREPQGGRGPAEGGQEPVAEAVHAPHRGGTARQQSRLPVPGVDPGDHAGVGGDDRDGHLVVGVRAA